MFGLLWGLAWASVAVEAWSVPVVIDTKVVEVAFDHTNYSAAAQALATTLAANDYEGAGCRDVACIAAQVRSVMLTVMGPRRSVVTLTSPIRSGSTLVFNLMRGMLGDMEVLKRHGPFVSASGELVVVVVRHPYNSVLSSIFRYGMRIDKSTLEQAVAEYMNNGGDHLLEQWPLVVGLVLRYENIVDDHRAAAMAILRYCGRAVEPELLDAVLARTDIDNVAELAASLGDDFGTVDRHTAIHGRHISPYRGKVDWRAILDPPLRAALAGHGRLAALAALLGYDTRDES